MTTKALALVGSFSILMTVGCGSDGNGGPARSSGGTAGSSGGTAGSTGGTAGSTGGTAGNPGTAGGAGAPPTPRFVDNGDGTVTDTQLGLTWSQAPNGGLPTQQEALALCEALDLGGYSDWYLPTGDELRTLSTSDATDGCYWEPVFTGDCSIPFVSSTTVGTNSFNVFVVRFSVPTNAPGFTFLGSNVAHGAARCVRGGAGPDSSGTTGGIGSDACRTCLEGCEGDDLCCIGLGCFCHDDCMVTECAAGTELCCGPYGDCICMADCPYT